MGSASRAKGRRAQTQGRQLLEGAPGWQVVDLSGGDAVEDCFAIDPRGNTWAVEVTADQGISMAAKWRQAARQAAERDHGARPLMLWRVDRAGWWLIARDEDVDGLRARPLELELHPSSALSFTSAVRQLEQLRPATGAAMPVLWRDGLVAAPAQAALERWWA